jgi:hypothetical protein
MARIEKAGAATRAGAHSKRDHPGTTAEDETDAEARARTLPRHGVIYFADYKRLLGFNLILSSTYTRVHVFRCGLTGQGIC